MGDKEDLEILNPSKSPFMKGRRYYSSQPNTAVNPEPVEGRVDYQKYFLAALLDKVVWIPICIEMVFKVLRILSLCDINALIWS